MSYWLSTCIKILQYHKTSNGILNFIVIGFNQISVFLPTVRFVVQDFLSICGDYHKCFIFGNIESLQNNWEVCDCSR